MATDPQPTSLLVNGQRHTLTLDPDVPLILALRNDLGLRGVRAGCSEGFCGSCTVLHEGKPIRSCTTPLSAVAHGAITTPEGLGGPEQPHPVQVAFLAEQAAQCGYCINGIIMTTAAAVAQGRSVDPNELAEGHLCRCGTHVRILRAVRRATSEEPFTAPASDGGEHGRPRQRATEHLDPASLPHLSDDADRVESWLRLLPDGRVAALTGKVELGQGIRTALGQIVAAQLGVHPDTVVVIPTTTASSRDEKYTAGSNSIDSGGAALGRAAVAFRRHLLDRARDLLDAPEDAEPTVDPAGAVLVGDRRCSFAEIAALGVVEGAIADEDVLDWRRLAPGTPSPRADLLSKLTGASAYVHDLALEGQVHARALLPPSYDARLIDLDPRPAAELPGVIEVVVDGRLVVAIAEREEQAVRAVSRLARDARWELPDTEADARSLEDHYRSLPSEPYVAAASGQQTAPTPTHRASFVVPYAAHGSIAPSCAVAQLHANGALEVHTHSQGVFPLRSSLAALLDMAEDDLTVLHRDGPGCYGHNLADDAAAFAALAALAVPGRPVRFQFTMEDEFTWEPYGPAMVMDLEATLDEAGRMRSWHHRGITSAHSTRPRGGAEQLAPAWLRTDALPRPSVRPFEGGARNAVPMYDIPVIDAVADHVEGPLRTSALRTLGSFANTFAGESFVDELAELAGADPVRYRLEHLRDGRARCVLQTAADAVAWQPRVGPSGRGTGIAVSRYKDEKAYVAAVAEVEVDTETAVIRVRRLTLACDAGTVINHDGLANQIEGGAVQALSRTLHEAVDFDPRGVTSRDWGTYPTIRFDEVPDIVVHVIDSDQPPLGAGEASLGPVAAAVANAVDDAIGVRLRGLPLTPKSITDRLFALDEREAGRVLLG